MARRQRKYLARRLEQVEQEAISGRRLLLAARGVVIVNLLLVGFNLWRGWRSTDYYYLFILGVWVALMLVQTRIYARRRKRVDDLQRQLDGTRGRKA